jgi:hypothetical protein
MKMWPMMTANRAEKSKRILESLLILITNTNLHASSRRPIVLFIICIYRISTGGGGGSGGGGGGSSFCWATSS